MSHRNSANATIVTSQLTLDSALVTAPRIANFAIISLTLVLLITNGGAG
jgi:hypothetical protein